MGYRVYFATSCGKRIKSIGGKIAKKAVVDGSCCNDGLYSVEYDEDVPSDPSDPSGAKASKIIIVPYVGEHELDAGVELNVVEIVSGTSNGVERARTGLGNIAAIFAAMLGVRWH